jgi:hypothetical protein
MFAHLQKHKRGVSTPSKQKYSTILELLLHNIPRMSLGALEHLYRTPLGVFKHLLNASGVFQHPQNACGGGGFKNPE